MELRGSGRPRARAAGIAALAAALLLTGCSSAAGGGNMALVYNGAAAGSASSAVSGAPPGGGDSRTGAGTRAASGRGRTDGGASGRGSALPGGDFPAADEAADGAASAGSGVSSKAGGAASSGNGVSPGTSDAASSGNGASPGTGASSSGGSSASPGSSGQAVPQPDALTLYNAAAAKAADADGLYYSYDDTVASASAARETTGYVRYAGRHSSLRFLQKSDDGRTATTVYADAGGVLERIVSGTSASSLTLPAGSASSPLGTLLLPAARAGGLSRKTAAASGSGWTVSLVFADCGGFDGVFGLISPGYVPAPGDCVRAASLQCGITADGWIEESEQQFDVRYRGAELTVRVERSYHSPGAAVTVQKPDF